MLGMETPSRCFHQLQVVSVGRTKRSDFFTDKQIEVLKLRAAGLSVDEIASRLGVTKSDIYAILRSIEATVAKARNTLKLYAEIVGGVKVFIDCGIPIESAISKIISEADMHGITIPLTSLELGLRIFKKVGSECIDVERGLVLCPLEVTVLPDGRISITRIEKES